MKVTIRQFQAINEIAASGLEEIDKSIEIVKVMTGMSQQKIENMNAVKFNRICKTVTRLFEGWQSNTVKGKPKNLLTVNGRMYRLKYDIYKMTADKYVEGLMFGQEPVKNLHKILATMAVPVKLTWKGLKEMPVSPEDHERISEDMLDADYGDIYHALVFFYAVSNEYLMSLDISGKTQEEQHLVRLLRLSVKSGDGFIKPRWYQNLKAFA